jgi:acyl-CoA thioesterase FadM
VLRATVGDIEHWPNVVAHASADYRREIPLGTREVVVRTSVVEIGRSSVRFAHDVGDGAAAVSAVLVAWDPQTRRARAITAEERDALLAGGVVTS